MYHQIQAKMKSFILTRWDGAVETGPWALWHRFWGLLQTMKSRFYTLSINKQICSPFAEDDRNNVREVRDPSPQLRLTELVWTNYFSLYFDGTFNGLSHFVFNIFSKTWSWVYIKWVIAFRVQYLLTLNTDNATLHCHIVGNNATLLNPMFMAGWDDVMQQWCDACCM